MQIAPCRSARAQVQFDDFVIEISEIGCPPDHRRRCTGITSRRHLHHLLAVADANAAEDLVATRDVGYAVDDRGRSVNVVIRLESPERLAVARVETIKAAVI